MSEKIANTIRFFGECGSIGELQEHFGYTKEKIVHKIMEVVN